MISGADIWKKARNYVGKKTGDKSRKVFYKYAVRPVGVPLVTMSRYVSESFEKTIPPELMAEWEWIRGVWEVFGSIDKFGSPDILVYGGEDRVYNLTEKHDARASYNVMHTAAEAVYDGPGGTLLMKLATGHWIPIPLSWMLCAVHDPINIFVLPYAKQGGKLDQTMQVYRAAIIWYNCFFGREEFKSIKARLKAPQKVTHLKLGELYHVLKNHEHKLTASKCYLIEHARTDLAMRQKLGLEGKLESYSSDSQTQKVIESASKLGISNSMIRVG